MEETECIVCFSRYDGEEYRPRVLPCGHSMCNECLKNAIREKTRKCPKCRSVYSAFNAKDIPINYSLESVMKLLNFSKTPKRNELHDCPEHQLHLSHRCSTHKAWICVSCMRDDHSSASCKIIPVSEELKIKKSAQIDHSKLLLKTFEKTCNKLDNYKRQCKTLIKERNENINRLQEEIQREKTCKYAIEGRYTICDHKLGNLKDKRNIYDQALLSLKSSKTIKEVSQCSVKVQAEAKNLQEISKEIENEVELIMQAFKDKGDHLLGYPKLSIREGLTHLHFLKVKDTYKPSPGYFQCTDAEDPVNTDGILTFLDFAWPGQDPRRVYIKMVGNTARARQHILLVTGHTGPSYMGLAFGEVIRKGQLGEYLILNPYDGKNAAPLLNNVTVNDVSKKLEERVGVVASGASSENNYNNAHIGFYLRDPSSGCDQTVFGQVTSGLEILQDVAKSNEIHKIKVTDCGVVLLW